MNINKLLLTIPFLLFISCSRSNDIIDELKGLELWESLNINDYNMTQTISCFCFPYEFTQPKDIEVENNLIISIDGKNPTETVGYSSFMTIDELFDFIESKLDEQPEFYEIEYNEEYGYPETLYFDMSKMIADEEIGYNVSNFKIYN
jgi:hypothetical protein